MYSAAISSCAKGTAWQLAIWLPPGRRSRGSVGFGCRKLYSALDRQSGLGKRKRKSASCIGIPPPRVW